MSSTSAIPTAGVRWLLFLFAIAVVCPIRYYEQAYGWDITWVHALNLAASQGLKTGRDIVWTTGPLSHLVFPQDIGENLSQALVFQASLWVALIVILWDLFFKSGFAPRNLIWFSIYFALSAPLYWFNYIGTDNLIVAGVMILLTTFRFRGGQPRYVAALALTGLVPLIKVSAGPMAGGAILGFLADRFAAKAESRWRDAALAALVPLSVLAAACALLLPNRAAIFTYFRSSLEIAGNYSSAMAISGDAIEFAGAAMALACAGGLVWLIRGSDREAARFMAALVAAPLFFSFKHGFVRQDIHVILFFCFVGLALGLISLRLSGDRHQSLNAGLVLLAYTIVWAQYLLPRMGAEALMQASGLQGLRLARESLDLAGLRTSLKARTAREFPDEARVPSEIRAITGDRSVASYSVAYGQESMPGMNIALYPVVQRYSAFTPFLDGLNAEWVRDKGPQFVIFDGKAIDGRHPWAETPAMWLETYRWYNTRLLLPGALLLERRPAPRFATLVPAGRIETGSLGPLDFQNLGAVTFWSMQCQSSLAGALRRTAFRVPEVWMAIVNSDGASEKHRIIPEVMTSPMPGRGLPASLGEFAAFFDAEAAPKKSIQRIRFEGPGASSYRSCVAGLWTISESSR